MTYAEAYKESLESPETFWGTAAEAIDWDRKWDIVSGPLKSSILPMVQRRRFEHVFQRCGPPRSTW